MSFGELSVREMSVWAIVRSGNYPSVNCPSGNLPSGNCPSGKCLWGTVRRGKVILGNVPQGTVLEPFKPLPWHIQTTGQKFNCEIGKDLNNIRFLYSEKYFPFLVNA